MNFMIKPKGTEYKNRMDNTIVLRPGKGTCEIEIAGASANNGSSIDWKTPIAQWSIGAKISGIFQIGSISLETTEDEKESAPAAKEKKDKK